jgi:hypothetical protein
MNDLEPEQIPFILFTGILIYVVVKFLYYAVQPY